MPQENVNKQIGEAWKLHREGKNSEAIKEFERVINIAHDSVDAHYGLGLALRADGSDAKATEAFQTAYRLTKDALKSVRAIAEAEGTIGNNMNSLEDDRYMMLTRMLKQRLNEMGVTAD